jgi:aldose 1-epimerase
MNRIQPLLRASSIAMLASSLSCTSTPAPDVAPSASRPPRQATIEAAAFGSVRGAKVDRYTLTNTQGLVVTIITYGAIVTEVLVPDRDGQLADVVLGFDTLEDYVTSSPYFGATVGRVANRIGGARFDLEGRSYALTANDGAHHLHGGTRGWDKRVWSATPLMTPEGPAIELTYVSPDGEEGYPGTVNAKVVYTLANSGEFRVEMSATADHVTLVNMVHHTYWNLGGHASGSVEDHELTLASQRYTKAVDLVPDGTFANVSTTPFDFTRPKRIGKDLLAAGGTPVGFDHNWVIDGPSEQLRQVAFVRHPGSGRTLTLLGDQPGVQFYSGNFLDGSLTGKNGARYEQYAGLCLETQKFPNSINIPEWRNQVILQPGIEYKHTMVHRLSAE